MVTKHTLSIVMKFYVGVAIRDIITYAKFGEGRFRCLGVGKGITSG